ncbi:MAG: hypothetical protein R2714_05040 [Microthrixaceae bacterium]
MFDRYGHPFPGGEDPVMDSIDSAAALFNDGANDASPKDYE